MFWEQSIRSIDDIQAYSCDEVKRHFRFIARIINGCFMIAVLPSCSSIPQPADFFFHSREHYPRSDYLVSFHTIES